MLEVKVRAAELLTSGQDAQLAKLNSKQIAALRFAGDDEFGRCWIARPARISRPKRSRRRSRTGVPICIAPNRAHAR